VRAEGVVRRECLGDKIRARRLYAFVHVLAPVTPRPSVEVAVAYAGQVVGWHVIAGQVTFVDDCPQHAGRRLDGQSVGVAHSEARTCCPEPSGVISSTAARRVSRSRPFSPMLLAEPTVTYSLLPSWLARMLRVQWLL